MSSIRKTKGVKLLLNAFDQDEEAKSVVALVEHLKGELNKTTVYRILERLENEGAIHSFTGKDGLTWYAKCQGCSSQAHTDKHPHFQCNTCNKVECIHVDINIPPIKNHKVNSTAILLTGECEACSSMT